MISKLQQQLDSFDPAERRDALGQLAEALADGRIETSPPTSEVNLHFHTFFSYNCYGYSPAKIAYLARKTGLAVAGTVDFDVLDGLDEFYEACALLDVKGSVGLETRVFIPEFAYREINSPGEPGISYNMGVGFPTSQLSGPTGGSSQTSRRPPPSAIALCSRGSTSILLRCRSTMSKTCCR